MMATRACLEPHRARPAGREGRRRIDAGRALIIGDDAIYGLDIALIRFAFFTAFGLGLAGWPRLRRLWRFRDSQGFGPAFITFSSARASTASTCSRFQRGLITRHWPAQAQAGFDITRRGARHRRPAHDSRHESIFGQCRSAYGMRPRSRHQLQQKNSSDFIY